MVAFYLWTLCGNICTVTCTFQSNNALTFYNLAALNLTWSCICACVVCGYMCAHVCTRVEITTEEVSVFRLNLYRWRTGTITVQYCKSVASFPGPAQLFIACVLIVTESWVGPGNEASKSAWWCYFYRNKNDALECCWFHLTSSEGVSVKHQCSAGKYSTSTFANMFTPC